MRGYESVMLFDAFVCVYLGKVADGFFALIQHGVEYTGTSTSTFVGGFVIAF